MDEFLPGSLLEVCLVCGRREFNFQKILWRELVEEWELQPHEEAAQIQALSVIEVNAAGTRFPYPKILSWHQLHCFPQLDLQ